MVEPFGVRVAEPGDRAAIDTLLEASYPVLMAGAYDAAVLEVTLPLMTRANPVLLSSGTFYVAVVGGECVVGGGGWSRERPGSGAVVPGEGHIRHFGTHPNWTGRGVGRAIYERCASDACAAGIERFECYASLNAEAFYAAMGFTRRERTHVRMGSLSLPVIAMERRL